MIALISDIHSNLEALEAVLADIRRRGAERVYCLGDVVGYGPDPGPCLGLAMEFDLVLCGNHDEAVTKSALGFNEIAEQAVDWTREILRPGWLSGPRRRRTWDFLSRLPLVHEEGDWLFVHGSPRNPTMEYIFETDAEDYRLGYSTKLEKIFQEVKRFCFVGHTHMPGVFTADHRFLSPEEFSYNFALSGESRAVINIGSVGQPRDRDNRACYALLNEQAVSFHRVAYDYRKTGEKIEQIKQLHPLSGRRLGEGE